MGGGNLNLNANCRYKGINLTNPKKYSNLVAWYDAAQITGLNDGDAVSSWNDVSGNSYHMIQAIADSRPTYKAAIKNGLPVVRFDGINDYFCTT
jgi:hypothetical protein